MQEYTFRGETFTRAEFWAMARRAGAYAAKRDRQRQTRQWRTGRMRAFVAALDAAKREGEARQAGQ